MRRRLRGNFFASDFAPSEIDGESETTFNEGSAITLHILRSLVAKYLVARLVGNRLLEIVAREAKLRQHHADSGRIDAGQHCSGQVLDLRLDAVEQRPRRRREVKPLCAAV